MPWRVNGWVGGRVWVDDDGRETFHIRKAILGRRYEVSTRCHSERAALKFLEQFEKDPEAFRVAPDPSDLLVIDDAIINDFCTWSASAKNNTPAWVEKQRTLLRWWRDVLPKRDLRRLTLRSDIAPRLDGVTSRPHRIAVLKAFYAWLRKEEHRLTAGEDPTLDLAVPQARPAQWKRSKVISRETEAALVKALPEEHADVVRMLAAIGCHVSEVVRFAKDGDVSPLGEKWVLTLPWTKGGGVHRMEVSIEVAEVARRILKRGEVSESALAKAVAKEARKLKLGRVGPGMFRHTFATRMVEAGSSPESVAAYLHHKSTQTTMRFYATLGVVPVPRPPAGK